MDKLRFYYVFLAALIPLITGFIWYSNALFGRAWMKASGTGEDKMKGGKMILVFLLTYVLGFLLASMLMPIVIHQAGVFSVMANEPGITDPNSEAGKYLADFMSRYGHNFRTFKHGAFHGTLAAIGIALPVVGIISLFERRSFKYVAIHTGYWILTMALMGGTVCALL